MYYTHTLRKATEPNVTILGFYPYPESETEADKTRFEYHYIHLMRSYNLSGQLIYEPEEAIIYGDRPIIAIEEFVDGSDSTELGEFIHPKDAVYIVGCTRFSHPSQHFNTTHIIHINTINPDFAMYGDQVLAMTIYDKFNKERIKND